MICVKFSAYVSSPCEYKSCYRMLEFNVFSR